MSRFSTISAQHSALRDIERQKLERKIGQLKREIDGCDQASAKGIGQRDERRFKPPRRRQLPPRCVSDISQNTANSDVGQLSSRSHKVVEALDDGESWRPGADINVGGERAPSVEIAWLWQASNRMDEDAQKVSAFLTKHGLDRYATLLEDEPNGLGASLELLAQADDRQLENAGMPASPRARLLIAVQAEVAAPAPVAATSSTPSRPRSMASANCDIKDLPKQGPATSPLASQPHTPGKWGCLGRAPPGWSVVKSESLASRVVQTADASTGSEVNGANDDEGSEVQDAAIATTILPDSSPQLPVCASPSEGQRRPTPQVALTQRSRPASAASRPGTSSGTTERVSCYQCYKQVVAKSAIVAEDPSCEAGLRQLCSEACANRFQHGLKERRERERQLSELRSSVLGGAEAGVPEDAC